MTPQAPKRLRLVLGAVLVLTFGGIIVWQIQHQPAKSRTSSAENTLPIPIPPYHSSEYLNTQSDATYVGSTACVDCHKNNHASYLLTAHSKALADVNPALEPPDGRYDHVASGRSYRVYRDQGQLRHEEILRDSDGRVKAVANFPVRYVVGSGHFCRSYLIEVDGFLHESPITWYTSRGKYDMSPGYDFKHHASFERPATQGCIHCHSGGASGQGTVNKLRVREQAVGCESCHGPGSKHVALQQAKPVRGHDLTIVNPGKLNRPLAEAVCGECHQGGVSVRLRGRQPGDFRPGVPWENQRMDYRAVGVDSKMTVTGHLEQLRLSKCYTNSQMTCITCHEPHAKQKPADPAAHFRAQCMTCHTAAACKAPAPERAKTKPADSCIACHMPRGATDIPHLAFSHHRIGIHTVKETPKKLTAPVLEPIGDESPFSPADRLRNLALAYLTAADKQEFATFAPVFEGRALPLLEEAYNLGLRDAETTQWLARLTYERDPGKAQDYARQTLAANDAHPEMRGYALMILANGDFTNKQYPAAIRKLKELVQLRRQADDWRFLGDCYLANDEPPLALAAFQMANEIRPFRPQNHAGLAEAYRRLGNVPKAKEHHELAEWLQSQRQE